MPKLRQPALLQKIAFDFLLQHAVHYCDQQSVPESDAEFQRRILMVKKEICRHLPWFLLWEFCEKFLDKFQSKETLSSYRKISLEIIMDMEIVGLRCPKSITEHLDIDKDGPRLRRLEELGFFDYNWNLEKLHLDDLTTFICQFRCTDYYLQVIGRNCSKLQVVKVRDSYWVTDEGISALNRCSELRVVDFVKCSLSRNGYNSFLSAHAKIEELACSDEQLIYLDDPVYPTINRLVLDLDNTFTPEKRHVITTKFPNLTCFKITEFILDDLSFLKSLDKLTELAIHHDLYMDCGEIEDWWGGIEILLRFIGANITSFAFTSEDKGYFFYQPELNFVYENCPNIEYLKYNHMNADVPPFAKLKKLDPVVDLQYGLLSDLGPPKIYFDVLPELEFLSLENFDVSFRVVRNMMLNQFKFPKLSVVKTICMKPEAIAKIEEIARVRNLDFHIDNSTESNEWVEEFYGRPSQSDLLYD